MEDEGEREEARELSISVQRNTMGESPKALLPGRAPIAGVRGAATHLARSGRRSESHSDPFSRSLWITEMSGW